MNINTFLASNTLYAVLIGAAVGGVAAYIGSLMVTRHMALTAGALGHLALPGVALALKYNFDVSLGALVFLIGGVFLIWALERQTKLPVEALTAVVFTTAVAIAFLFLPHEKVEVALLGDVSHITLITCLITLVASLLIFAVSSFIFNRMVLITVAPDIAKASRINVAAFTFVYLICIACMIALGVRIIGGLMTAALVAIPASTSRNVSANLFQYTYISLFLGGISCVIGILLSQLTTFPVGSLIIIVSASFFCVSLIVKLVRA